MWTAVHKCVKQALHSIYVTPMKKYLQIKLITLGKVFPKTATILSCVCVNKTFHCPTGNVEWNALQHVELNPEPSSLVEDLLKTVIMETKTAGTVS